MSDYEPKVMFYNAEAGAPLPGEPHKVSDGRVSIPVEMLFNENSTVGEVTPLMSAEVSYKDQGVSGRIRFQEGENIILGHTQLSARPGIMDMSLASKYADRLVVPLGQENHVRPEGIKATKAVIAANPMLPNMDRWDGARLERHLAYGDEIYAHQGYESVGPDDWKNKAMINTGRILCGDVGQLHVDGALLFDLHEAARGQFTGDEVREHYANGGHRLDRVPGSYKDADRILTGSFAELMKDAPADKQELSKALADQWDKLDQAMGGMNEKTGGQVALMHVACYQMGWDFIPTPDNAAKLEESLESYHNGDTKAFETIIEKSLSQHPQPQREVGFPDHDTGKAEPGAGKPHHDDAAKQSRAMSNLDRMHAMMADADGEKEDESEYQM